MSQHAIGKIRDIPKKIYPKSRKSYRKALRAESYHTSVSQKAVAEVRALMMQKKMEVFARETLQIIDMQNRHTVAILLFDLIPLRPLSGLVFQYTFDLVG